MGEKRVFILLGAPGTGKGTQADRIADTYKLYHIDTGQCIRSEIGSGSELGKEAKSYVDQGQLIPFPLVLKVIKSSMSHIAPEQNGYLFDGFPRNLEQADGLDQILTELSLSINSVIYMDTPFDILMDRLAYRVTCSECGTKFNLKVNPPKQDNVCDMCQTETLITRKDDQPDVIENRLKAYESETAPLVSHYEQRGTLARVDANQSIEGVFHDIQQRIGGFFQESDTITV